MVLFLLYGSVMVLERLKHLINNTDMCSHQHAIDFVIVGALIEPLITRLTVIIACFRLLPTVSVAYSNISCVPSTMIISDYECTC